MPGEGAVGILPGGLASSFLRGEASGVESVEEIAEGKGDEKDGDIRPEEHERKGPKRNLSSAAP